MGEDEDYEEEIEEAFEEEVLPYIRGGEDRRKRGSWSGVDID